MAQALKIELVKVIDDRSFGRGERMILVDGEIWGRTFVTQHGSHGTRHRFGQEGDGVEIEARPGEKYPGAEEVWPHNKRRRRNDDNRSTDELIIEKVRALIVEKKLRHPDIVRAENAESMRLSRQERDSREVAEAHEFRAKAREALGMNFDNQDSAMVDRVVEAMRWAQTK